MSYRDWDDYAERYRDAPNDFKRGNDMTSSPHTPTDTSEELREVFRDELLKFHLTGPANWLLPQYEMKANEDAGREYKIVCAAFSALSRARSTTGSDVSIPRELFDLFVQAREEGWYEDCSGWDRVDELLKVVTAAQSPTPREKP